MADCCRLNGLMGPEVTVVIPTLNRWPMLSRALSGALGQEDVTLEVVVVDDGSGDETPQRLAAHADERLRVVRHERPLGVARARNAGLAEARGEWTAFLDDDDLWAPRKLREQLDAAAAVDAVMAVSYALVVDEGLRPIGIDPVPPSDRLRAELIRSNCVPGGCSNTIARTAALQEAGGFDEQLAMLADWDLWLRLADAGPAASCTAVHVVYVDHAGSMHVRRARITTRELAYLRRKHAALEARLGTELGAGGWVPLYVAAGQHRAGQRLRAASTYLRSAVRDRSRGALLRAALAPFSDRMVRHDLIEPLLPAGDPPPWLAGYVP
jgi:glycosyltransferase involved in cell wall biosynthesis